MIKTIVTIVILFWFSWAEAYTPPKGIPDPADSFGAFGEIDQATPSTATKCPNWPGASSAGCYYVDSTDGDCSDAGSNPGYPALPRCTVPSLALSAGNFVYVHAGTYAPSQTISGVGTAENPIWITGNASSKPTISGGIIVGTNAGSSSYIVLENFNSNTIDIRPADDDIVIDHLLIRNMTIVGNSSTEDNSGVLIGGTGSYDGSSTSYVVVYNSDISDFGAVTSDQCGVYVQDVNYAWILNNIIHGVNADGVAGCHNCTAGQEPTNIFVGVNTIYADREDNGENCIDFKGVQGFVISENECYGPMGREQGWGIVIHAVDGASPFSQNGWIIFNKIYHVSSGIAFVSTPNIDMYVVGNLIYDIDDSYAVQEDSSYNGRGILAVSNEGDLWIVDNTLYACDEGIKIDALVEGDLGKIHGNIISGRTDADRYEINVATGYAYVDMDYNLFYGPEGTSEFYWNGAARTFAYMQATASECTNCKDGVGYAPADVFTNAAGNNFTLKVGSSAIGINVEGPVGATVYDAFNTAWSIAIEKDYAGTSRPQGGTWDIGAYEYALGGGANHISIGAGISFGAGISLPQ